MRLPMTTLWQASQQLQSGDALPEAFTESALQAAQNPEQQGSLVFTQRYAAAGSAANARWQAKQA